MQEYECHYCGKVSKAYKSRLEASERNFCNIECRSKWHKESGIVKGKNNSSWKGGITNYEFECDYCGQESTRPKAELDNRKNNFCSRKCYNKWQSENMKGENNFAWVDEKVEYTAKHDRIERKHGTPNKCDLCLTTKENKTYDWAKVDGLDKYVRLCRPCHVRYDDPNLNWEQVEKIRKLYRDNEFNQYELAERYDVTQSTISTTVNRETWTNAEKVNKICYT
jgi:hypothetical protein